MQTDKITILLIDDEKLIVEMLTTFLSKKGFEITGLTDSREALECIKANTYDIVLTDLKMPDVSGMDIINAVKSSGKDIEMIIFTGYATIDSAIEAIRQGVYDYIKKPFRLEEILFAINRAVEKLVLRRQIIAYQNRIEKMLSDITMLVDISSILYQIPDFDMAIEMILDTLTEGMKIKRAGLFLKDESMDYFTIRKSKGLSRNIVNEFKFHSSDSINDFSVSLKDPIIISDIESGLYISNRNIKTEKDLTCCILIPIGYLESLLGFIGIFQMSEEIQSFDDEIKLLKVLATQVAPVFQALEKEIKGVKVNEEPFDGIILNTVEDRLSTAKQLHSTVSFALLKLARSEKFSDITTARQNVPTFKEIVLDEFESKGEVILLNFDFFLIILPTGNSVNIELSCVDIQVRIEELIMKEKQESTSTLKYAIQNYPVDGNSVSEITNRLWLKLFNELEKDDNSGGNTRT